MPDFTDAGERLRAQLHRSVGMYRSFYTGLGEVHQEIGDDALSDFCTYKLGYSLSILQRQADLLHKADADRIKRELKPAISVQRQITKLREYEKKEKEKNKLAEARQKTKNQKAQFVERVKGTIPAPALTHFLARSKEMESEYDIALGEIYAELKRAVDAGAAGVDPDGRPWAWRRWAPLHLGLPISRINHCILCHEERQEAA